MVADRLRTIKLYEEVQYVNTVTKQNKKPKIKPNKLRVRRQKRFACVQIYSYNFKYGNHMNLSKVNN